MRPSGPGQWRQGSAPRRLFQSRTEQNRSLSRAGGEDATNATKSNDDVNAAAEQGRSGRDPPEPDSRDRDLTRVMKTWPLARSSLL